MTAPILIGRYTGNMNSIPAISLRNLRFAYPGAEPGGALDIEQFDVAQGESVFLQGVSGSGKSTLLNLIGGVLQPVSGEISLLGTRLSSLSSSKRDSFRADHLGYVFQMFNLLPYLDVISNVTLALTFSPLRLSRLNGASAQSEAQRLLLALGLGESIQSKRVAQLSVGQQQRVACARALIGKPELIVADEPTSALDAQASQRFVGLLLAQAREAGASVVFVSHEANLAGQFDRTLDMATLNRAAVAVDE